MTKTRTSRRAAAKKTITQKNTEIRTIIDTFISGFIHSDWDVSKHLKKGSELVMIHEIDNPYDQHAIKLMMGGVKVGYLPRNSRHSYVVTYNKVWEAINNKIPIRCTVLNHAIGNPSYYAVKIRVEGEYPTGPALNKQGEIPSF